MNATTTNEVAQLLSTLPPNYRAHAKATTATQQHERRVRDIFDGDQTPSEMLNAVRISRLVLIRRLKDIHKEYAKAPRR